MLSPLVILQSPAFLLAAFLLVSFIVFWTLRSVRQELRELRERDNYSQGVRDVQLEHMGEQLQEKLLAVERGIRDLERRRLSGDVQLKEQLRSFHQLSENLRNETSRLAHALTNTRVQGNWGEAQLRNVINAAGMLEFCDFLEQPPVQRDEDGESRVVRPDVVVRLPNGYHVVIDAKAPTKGYLEALSAPNATVREQKLVEYIDALKRTIRATAARQYPSFFKPALDYTVLFLPGESFYYAALEGEAELLRFAEAQRVLLTTPMSLLAFLRTVSLGWVELKFQNDAKELATLGREFYQRLEKFTGLFNQVGSSLERSVTAYNQAASSLELRLLKSARKFHGLQDSSLHAELEVTNVTQQSRSEILVPGLIKDPRIVDTDEA